MNATEKLFRAERKKIKRLRMVWVGYLSILFSFIITLAQQYQMNRGSISWANMVDVFVYNNTTLFLPFSIALIGGYIIDREYAQDTLKNMLVIPVYPNDLVKAKIALLFVLAAQLAFFEITLSLLSGLFLGFDGVVFWTVCRYAFRIFLSNICVSIGILPVILLCGRTKGKYIWGSILSMLIGVSGIFVISGGLSNWHPVTASLSITTDMYHAINMLDTAKSIIAIILYALISVMLYHVVYKKNCTEIQL